MTDGSAMTSALFVLRSTKSQVSVLIIWVTTRKLSTPFLDGTLHLAPNYQLAGALQRCTRLFVLRRALRSCIWTSGLDADVVFIHRYRTARALQTRRTCAARQNGTHCDRKYELIIARALEPKLLRHIKHGKASHYLACTRFLNGVR